MKMSRLKNDHQYKNEFRQAMRALNGSWSQNLR